LVAAWNEAENIRMHVASILRLRFEPKELILCAGGDDGTYLIAKGFESPTVKVLEQKRGEGKQKALKRCLELASGEVIFLTDADCIVDDHAFEATIAPIAAGEEVATTGTRKPLKSQMGKTFVLQQWFGIIYGDLRRGPYVTGLLGSNAAISRSILEEVGSFDEDVTTGTDYVLAKRLLSQNVKIRFVRDSAIETWFPDTFLAYLRSSSRWLRNVVIHGIKYEAFGEVYASVRTSLIGVLFLLGGVAGMALGGFVLAVWITGFCYAIANRWRYLSIGSLITQRQTRLRDYALSPIYFLLDLAVWTVPLVQYPFKRLRSDW